MTKRILIINGNPARERISFSEALANSYIEGAKNSGHEIKQIEIAKLNFDPILHEGYEGNQSPEPDLIDAQEKVIWAEHVVFIYPMWQFNIPALLKGFCERAFVAGFAYDVNAKNPLDVSLLKGRSGRIIQTMGMPGVLYDMMFGAHGGKSFKSMLGFAGIKPVRTSYLGMIDDKKSREKHLTLAFKLGEKAK